MLTALLKQTVCVSVCEKLEREKEKRKKLWDRKTSSKADVGWQPRNVPC